MVYGEMDEENLSDLCTKKKVILNERLILSYSSV